MYKGQGRSRRALVTRAYGTFLVRGGQLQAPVPTTPAARGWPTPSGGATPCGRHCSTRAAQSVEGHHRPASATAFVRLVAGARPPRGPVVSLVDAMRQTVYTTN